MPDDWLNAWLKLNDFFLLSSHIRHGTASVLSAGRSCSSCTLQFLCKRYYCWLLELSRLERTVRAPCSSGCWAEQSCPGAARCSEVLISGEQLSRQACWQRTRGWWQSTPHRPGSGEILVGKATGGSQLLKLSQLASLAGRETVGAAKDMTFLMLIRKGGSIHNSLIYVFMLHVSLI